MPLAEVVKADRPHEMPGSGKMTMSKAGIVGTRIYSIPWVDSVDGTTWWQFCGNILGNPTKNLLPESFSDEIVDINGKPFLFCTEADLEGETIDGIDDFGKLKYKRAIVKAKYSAIDMAERLSINGQILTEKGKNFSWAGTSIDDPFPAVPKPLTEDVGKLVPLGEYTFEKHQVLLPNFYQILGLVGTVNKFPVLGFPPEGLLFVGAEAQRTWLPAGVKVWDMKYNFLTNFGQGGFLQQYRAELARYEYIKTIAFGDDLNDQDQPIQTHLTLYPRRKFDALFVPPF
jgi:hypothetical protein